MLVEGLRGREPVRRPSTNSRGAVRAAPRVAAAVAPRPARVQVRPPPPAGWRREEQEDKDGEDSVGRRLPSRASHPATRRGRPRWPPATPGREEHGGGREQQRLQREGVVAGGERQLDDDQETGAAHPGTEDEASPDTSWAGRRAQGGGGEGDPREEGAEGDGESEPDQPEGDDVRNPATTNSQWLTRPNCRRSARSARGCAAALR